MTLPQTLEKTLLHWEEISGFSFCLLDDSLQTIAATCDKKLPPEKKLTEFLESGAMQLGNTSYHLAKVSDQKNDYLLILWGTGASAPTIASLAVCQVESLFDAYRSRTDKNAFMQNLLLGSYSEVEIFNRAKKLRISAEVPRVVFLIETKFATDEGVLATIRNIFSARSADFITALDNSQVILIRELRNTDSTEDMEQIASLLVDMLNTEVMTSAWASYSRPAPNLAGLVQAYREASAAMEIGKIFQAQKNVFGYQTLGIGRLIHELPQETCRMFLDEIFRRDTLESIDEETMTIIRTFFENNLNLSETARKLYVHRNTLVYRFEKLEKKIGLDIRRFEDALTFKIAMMVADYLKSGHGNAHLL